MNRHLVELDIQIEGAGGKARLIQVAVVDIEAEDPPRSAPLGLNGIEAAIAADVEDVRAAEVDGNGICDVLPLDARKVAQEMIGGCRYAMQIDIVKPLAQFLDLA